MRTVLQVQLDQRLACSLSTVRQKEFIVIQVPVFANGACDVPSAERAPVPWEAGVRAGRCILHLLRCGGGNGFPTCGIGTHSVSDGPARTTLAPSSSGSLPTAAPAAASCAPLDPSGKGPGEWRRAGGTRWRAAEAAHSLSVQVFRRRQLALGYVKRCLAAGCIQCAWRKRFDRLQRRGEARLEARACCDAAYRALARLDRFRPPVYGPPDLSDDNVLEVALWKSQQLAAHAAEVVLPCLANTIKRLKLNCRCGAALRPVVLKSKALCGSMTHSLDSGNVAIICPMAKCKYGYTRCLPCGGKLLRDATLQEAPEGHHEAIAYIFHNPG